MNYTTPAAAGIEPGGILSMLKAFEEKCKYVHGFVIARKGEIVSEGWRKPYGPHKPHMLFSLTKSFTSIAAGFAMQEGLFKLDDTALNFFPNLLSNAPCEYAQKITVRNLLTMASGHEIEPPIEHDQYTACESFFAHFVKFEPGSRFNYNTAATGVVAYIIEKTSGQGLDNFLKERLFDKLGITDFSWEHLKDGTCTGGYGLALNARDIAKFGVFLLNKGVWNGERLLNEEYITEATREQIRQESGTLDWVSGYGYQFWICSQYGAYRGDGAFGQLCVVFPAYDLVVAINAGLVDMQGEMDVIFNTLLPAVKDSALEEDPAAMSALEDFISEWGFSPPEGNKTSPAIELANGKVYDLVSASLEFSSLKLAFDTNATLLTLTVNDKEVTLRVGWGEFERSNADVGQFNQHYNTFGRSIIFTEVYTAGAWNGNEYSLLIIPVHAPYVLDIKLLFEGSFVRVIYDQRVSFWKSKEICYGMACTC
ncbi:MAG: beta-lactamase family protein [Clostridiales bacterium]|nr:beta-lactamase family protein [Clostridiales bacterium]